MTPGPIPPLNFTGGSAVRGDAEFNPDFGDVSPVFGPFRGNATGGPNWTMLGVLAVVGVITYALAKRL